jgi:hypothetical protein
MRMLVSRIGCLVTFLWVAAVTGLHAQQTPPPSTILTPVPRVLWFSGAFRPADHLPVAPVETVTVAVYRDRDGGDALWRETQTVTMEADCTDARVGAAGRVLKHSQRPVHAPSAPHAHGCGRGCPGRPSRADL